MTGHLAARFGVACSSIGEWSARHPEFVEVGQQGRDVADAVVIESLFTRAAGYDCKAERSSSIAASPDGDLHPACSARDQSLHVLAAPSLAADWPESAGRAQEEADHESWRAELRRGGRISLLGRHSLRFSGN